MRRLVRLVTVLRYALIELCCLLVAALSAPLISLADALAPSMSFIEGPHPLLESHSPAYTNATVRRAFIVWMHCGQKNSFKDVCNYYHHLESLEDTLPVDRRATSRHHEFNMFSNPPPTSPFLNQIFPNLYSQNNTIHHYIKKSEVNKNDSSSYKLEGFNDMKTQNGVSTNDILDTSHMIRKYCKSHMIPLRKFLTEFKDYAKKCELKYTVSNVAFYIKRKMVEEELLMVENYSKCLNFLNLNSFEKSYSLNTKTTVAKAGTFNTGTEINGEEFKFLMNSQKQITVLTKDNKEDLINQYWNDLTSNYVEMGLRHNVTRT